MFSDFGDFLNSNNAPFEAMYIQDYGVLFFLRADFVVEPGSVSPDPLTATPADPVDPVWQQAQADLQTRHRRGRLPRPQPNQRCAQGQRTLEEFQQTVQGTIH